MIKYKHHFLRYLPQGVVVEVQEVGGCCCLNVGRFMSTAAAAREVVASDDGSGSNNNNNKRRGVKMSKQERKSMVVDFVNKYRLTNAGKFPTASYTKDQIGGSYYRVRSIIQELQYDSNLSEVAVTDKTTKLRNSNKVNGVSDVTNSVDSVISSHISGEDDVSIMSIPLETTSETSVPKKTTKVIEVSKSREILDSDVPLREGVSSSDHVISSGDFANGETLPLKVKEGPNLTVATTDVNLLFEQMDTERVGGVVDTEVHANVKQVVVDRSSDQNMIVDEVSDSGTSVDLDLSDERKMSTSDVVRGDDNEYLNGTQMLATIKSEKATTVDQDVKATFSAPGSLSEPDNPESLSSSRSTTLPEMDNASSPASAIHPSTSESMEKTEEKQSLWGNLKSFASGFINNWWKS